MIDECFDASSDYDDEDVDEEDSEEQSSADEFCLLDNEQAGAEVGWQPGWGSGITATVNLY